MYTGELHTEIVDKLNASLHEKVLATKKSLSFKLQINLYHSLKATRSIRFDPWGPYNAPM